MADFHTVARPHVEAALEPSEELRGFCAATRTSLFKGTLVALAATDRRLLLVPLDRRIQPAGDVVSLPHERIASASAEGPRASVTLKLRTTDGEKLKLNMMRGGGPLGGGPEQEAGVEAVAAALRGR